MSPDALLALADALDAALLRHSIAPWYPRVIDDDGDRFHQDFDARWRPAETRRYSVVYQARHVWTLATLARRRPELRAAVRADGVPANWQRWAARGLESMMERFSTGWPGGVAFHLGRPEESDRYAGVFALYAAAAVARLTGDEAHLRTARAIHGWLGRAGWDPEAEGYSEALAADGAPRASGPDRRPGIMGIPVGAHSSNVLLHSIEALLEWGAAAPSDAAVRGQLLMLVHRLEARVAGSGGRLFKSYDRRGRPLDRIRSFGHDVEVFHLVTSARALLGRPAATPTEALARRALREGWDRRHGGLWFGRGPGRWRRRRHKVWWVQAEALLALATLAARASGEARRAALARLRDQWDFVLRCQLDETNGGWIDTVSRRGDRILADAKAHEWKATYHEVRALLDTADLLRRLARDVST